MIGWLKLHRKILESSMYKNLNSKQRDVMYVCLIKANHEPNDWIFEGEKFMCEAGQFITSLNTIARYCGKDVKVQSVRTSLLKLEKWGFLTNKSTKTGRLITICKWEDYQSNEPVVNKASNKDLTKSQQRPNKDLTSIKEVKNEKNDKEYKEKNIKEFQIIKSEILENRNWIELAMKKSKLSKMVVEKSVKDYFEEWEGCDDIYRNKRDYMQHCLNKFKQSNGTSTTDTKPVLKKPTEFKGY